MTELAAAQAPVFQAGGPLRQGALYVERSADHVLPGLLREGNLCFVLAPRQMGKSSLRERTAELLQAEGIHCVSLDLTAIGGETTSAAEWYFGLLTEITDKLPGFGIDPVDCWERFGDTTNAQRLVRFLREEVGLKVPGRIVLFIDEIDAVRALSFSSDEFFAALRAISISGEESFSRLTFCLLGVVQPEDLIQRQDITSFNVGKSVPLADFSRAEVEPFLQGLSAAEGDSKKLLDAVYNWTSGHPYMMQRLCEGIVSARGRKDLPADERRRVAALVDELFLRRGQATDANLGYAQKRFERQYRTPRTARMLELYSRLLHSGAIAATGQDVAEGDLLLAGMAAIRPGVDGPRLVVRNRIFASFFDAEWVKSQQQDRLFGVALGRWLELGRDDRYVLREADLREAEAWAAGRDDLTQDEQRFLRASLRVENRELAHQKAEQQRALEAEAQKLAERLARVEEERAKAEVERTRAESTAALEAEHAAKAEAERALVEAEQRFSVAEIERKGNRRLITFFFLTVGLMIALWILFQQLTISETSARQRKAEEERRQVQREADQRVWDALGRQGQAEKRLQQAEEALGKATRQCQKLERELKEMAQTVDRAKNEAMRCARGAIRESSTLR